MKCAFRYHAFLCHCTYCILLYGTVLTEVEVVVVIKSQSKVHARIAETGAVVRAYAIRTALSFPVGTPASNNASPPKVVNKGRARRTVQPNLC